MLVSHDKKESNILHKNYFYYQLLFTLCAVTLFLVALFKLHGVAPETSESIIVFDSGAATDSREDEIFPVTLPHDWRLERYSAETLWYKFTFDLKTTPSDLAALYFPTFSQNLIVYLNGIESGDGGHSTEPMARNWPRPLIIPIIPERLKQGSNEVTIYLLSDPPNRGLLGEFYLGTWTELQPWFERRQTLKLTAPNTFVVIQVIASLFLFFISWRRPQNTEYAWAAATFIGLTGHALPMLITNIPISTFYWEWWQHVSIGHTIFFILIFTNRYFDQKAHSIEIAALIWVTLSALFSLGFGIGQQEELYFRFGGRFWGYTCVSMSIYPLQRVVRETLARKDFRTSLVLGAAIVLFVLGTHDTLFVLGVKSSETGYLFHYASPLVALLLTSILIIRFIETSHDLENLNESLEKRIDEKSQQLETTYKEMEIMERQRLLAEEREHFNREIHDGLGGYLSSALSIAEDVAGDNSTLSETLRDATEEMRLMLDTAEAGDGNIGMIIGTHRRKLQRQCEAAGFSLRWNVNDTTQANHFGPSGALNIIRIVQEALANALRHSKGDIVCISVVENDATLRLEIADNGVCNTLFRPEGNGIKNIETRAAEIGAYIDFDTNGQLGGLSVVILLPLTDHVACGSR